MKLMTVVFSRKGRRNWEHSVIRNMLCSVIVLFQSELRLVVNIYCKCCPVMNRSSRKLIKTSLNLTVPSVTQWPPCAGR